MTRPSAVLDTSCTISYYLGNKSLAHAAVDQLRKTHRLLVSKETYSEFRQVILRPKFDRIPLAIRLEFVSSYRELVDFFDPDVTVTACIDPKDDKFLSLAVSGNATLILTGDKDLLALHPFRNIDILTPAAFLALHTR